MTRWTSYHAMVILAELEGAVGDESHVGRKDRLALLAENGAEAKAKSNQENGRPKDPPKQKVRREPKVVNPKLKPSLVARLNLSALSGFLMKGVLGARIVSIRMSP